MSDMKAIIIEFIEGPWHGRALRTDSTDREEVWLAAAYYEMSHHGAIGERCDGLCCDAVNFARRHGWLANEDDTPREGDHYLVAERRETEMKIHVSFKYDLITNASVPLVPAH